MKAACLLGTHGSAELFLAPHRWPLSYQPRRDVSIKTLLLLEDSGCWVVVLYDLIMSHPQTAKLLQKGSRVSDSCASIIENHIPWTDKINMKPLRWASLSFLEKIKERAREMEIWIVCCHMDACFSVEPWFKMHRAASLFCRRGKLTGRHVDRVCAHVSRKWSMLWQDFIQMHLKRIKSQTSFPALSTNSTRQRVGDDCLPRRKASTAADPRFVWTRRFFKTRRIFG